MRMREHEWLMWSIYRCCVLGRVIIRSFVGIVMFTLVAFVGFRFSEDAGIEQPHKY